MYMADWFRSIVLAPKAVQRFLSESYYPSLLHGCPEALYRYTLRSLSYLNVLLLWFLPSWIWMHTFECVSIAHLPFLLLDLCFSRLQLCYFVGQRMIEEASLCHMTYVTVHAKINLRKSITNLVHWSWGLCQGEHIANTKSTNFCHTNCTTKRNSLSIISAG